MSAEGAVRRPGVARAAPRARPRRDLSSQMLEQARSALHVTTTTSPSSGRRQVHPFDAGAFDVAISRHGLDVLRRSGRRLHELARSLHTGARFVQLVWQGVDENGGSSSSAARSRPVATSRPDRPTRRLRVRRAGRRSLLTQQGSRRRRRRLRRGMSRPHTRGAFRNVSGMGFVGFMLRDLDDPSGDALATSASIAHTPRDGVLYARPCGSCPPAGT